MDVSGTRKFFTYGTVMSKIVILILLIAFSYINADPSFISVNPKLFITESILSGALIGLPVMWIMTNRGVPFASTIPAGVSAFMLFYLFHVFMEFSGGNKEMNEGPKSNVTKWSLIIGGSLMLLISLVIHDFTPGFGTIMLETVVMAALGASLELYKAYNRGHKDHLKKFLKMFLLIGLTTLILQLGGLYTQISPTNNFQT
jgi:ribose/xylose/arabinose/galactoside ABC-type transport system permease subunit